MSETTIEQKREIIDGVLTRASNLALEETGAPLGMLLDRMLTLAAAHAVGVDGQERTAAAFRHIADKIGAGLFAHLEGKMTAYPSKRH